VRREVIGLIGVLGPRRMPYERSIGSVRYIAGLMSDLVARLYPGPRDLEDPLGMR
jgi:heat-inducible transcriptional repressor